MQQTTPQLNEKQISTLRYLNTGSAESVGNVDGRTIRALKNRKLVTIRGSKVAITTKGLTAIGA